MRFLLLFALLSGILAFPAFFFAIHYNVFGFRLFNAGSLLLNATIACIFVIIGVIDWGPVLSCTFAILIHTSGISAWQEHCLDVWSASNVRKLPQRVKEKLHVNYKIQQVMHTLAMRIAGTHILPVIIPCAESMIIIMTFITIRFYTEIPLMLLIVGLLVTIDAAISLQYAIQLAVQTTINSERYIQLQLSRMVWVTPMDKTRFRSYRPMQWRIGNMFTLTKHSSAIIMQNVVVDNVVNLLVAYN